ncbi:protein of unknown function DUF72 [Desulfovibrio sp. X2]|uniref:DUF72 domain-containing protein n=1 Tax=Desulfovibrio sp. X2 TaxID=941449 RepID=UPI0003588BC7|nr:DUF72 domain-containing protein [Desulfovibrio sp. X2]EPR43981.1 protein of unknown function DUF72 [Desulfovibrio sp. X2]
MTSAARARGRCLVGTSGWSYAHWHGPFYPEDLGQDGELGYYARRFRSVEVNATFYRLPEAHTVRAWREQAGPGFVFACKASRYATHMKKLKAPGRSTGKLFAVLREFGEALGPVLFQLPPRWSLNLPRLRAFLAVLPEGLRCAFELRDRSWIVPSVLDLLEKAGAAFCIYELAGYRSPREVTAPFVYLRLHGPGDAYQGSYADEELADWAGAARAWLEEGRDVYCYFDNDQQGFAARDAARLRDLLADGPSG